MSFLKNTSVIDENLATSDSKALSKFNFWTPFCNKELLFVASKKAPVSIAQLLKLTLFLR